MTSKDLGLVTAYAYAVSQGYTGTEEEFAELMASYATVAEEAAESAAEAAASAEAAGASETNAASSAASAGQSATSAGNSATSASGSAVQAQSSATAAGQSATQAAGSATAAGNSATAAAGSASQAAASETAAGASATAAAGSATSASGSATAAAGSATEADASADRAREILDSIPEDYSELSDDVADLKSDLNQMSSVNATFTLGTFVNVNGVISTGSKFAMSNDIELAKGNTITAFIKTFSTGFSAIAVKNADGTYTKKVQSDNTTTWGTVTYTATSDCIVVISTYSDEGDISKAKANIYANGEVLQSDLIDIKDKLIELEKYGYELRSLTFVSGKFINHNGAESSNANYERTTDIAISKNQTIHFYAQGVSTIVSLLAKHNIDGTFTPLIVCTDDTPVWKTYKATENCNVVISSKASLTVVAETYYTKDFFDYVGEKVGSIPDGLNPLKKLRYDGGFTRIFDSIGCIGDSLASGETYSNEGGSLSVHSPNWPISWGDRIAKICNNTAVHLSRGGQTTKTWLEEWSSNTAFTDNACKAYIVALGANDSNGVNSMVLGNQSDAESVVVTPGTSFYGNYSQIIRDIKAVQPKAKIFVVTVPTSNAETKGFNTAIRYMATYYTDVYVIDLYIYGLDIYNAMTTNSGLWRASHGNSLSYMIIAWHLSTYIDWIINNNYSEFSQVEYIGTDWSWTDN